MIYQSIKDKIQPKQVFVFLTIAALILAVFAPQVAAEEKTNNKKEWEFNVGIYLWGASIGGKSASGDDVDIDFSDLIDNLKMGFMGVGEVRKGKWLFMTDAVYLDVEKNRSGGIREVDLYGWVVTPAVGYNVIEAEKGSLDLLAGARYLWLKSELDFIEGRKFSGSGDVWDGIVGLKGRINLAKNWYLPLYLDIGTGDTDLTWQAFGGIAYKFSRLDVILAYRYLSWDFDDKKKVFDDLNFHGPFAGVQFSF